MQTSSRHAAIKQTHAQELKPEPSFQLGSKIQKSSLLLVTCRENYKTIEHCRVELPSVKVELSLTPLFGCSITRQTIEAKNQAKLRSRSGESAVSIQLWQHYGSITQGTLLRRASFRQSRAFSHTSDSVAVLLDKQLKPRTKPN
jgi:hypothetical protein